MEKDILVFFSGSLYPPLSGASRCQFRALATGRRILFALLLQFSISASSIFELYPRTRRRGRIFVPERQHALGPQLPIIRCQKPVQVGVENTTLPQIVRGGAAERFVSCLVDEGVQGILVIRYVNWHILGALLIILAESHLDWRWEVLLFPDLANRRDIGPSRPLCQVFRSLRESG